MARGYFDLEKAVGTRSSAEIVAAARSRFEAEREATFIEMTNAFECRRLDGLDFGWSQARFDHLL